MDDNRLLCDLCRTGTPETIGDFLEQHHFPPEKLNHLLGWRTGICRSSFMLPLTAAVEGGRIGNVRYLLENGADPDKELRGTTPRQMALRSPEVRKLFAGNEPWWKKIRIRPQLLGSAGYSERPVPPAEAQHRLKRLPDIAAIVRRENWQPVPGIPEAPLRVLLLTGYWGLSAAAYPISHELIRRAKEKQEQMRVDFARFLFPRETSLFHRDAARHFRTTCREWDLGTAPGPVAEAFVRKMNRHPVFCRDGNAFSFRTVWPSCRPELVPESFLEKKICQAEKVTQLFLELVHGTKLHRPDILLSEEFLKLPANVKELVCCLAVDDAQFDRFYAALRQEGAHPTVLDTMTRSRAPLDADLPEMAEKLMESIGLFPEPQFAQLTGALLTPHQQIRLLAAILQERLPGIGVYPVEHQETFAAVLQQNIMKTA